MHAARGRIGAGGHGLEAGDALEPQDVERLVLGGGSDAELLVFDLRRVQD